MVGDSLSRICCEYDNIRQEKINSVRHQASVRNINTKLMFDSFTIKFYDGDDYTALSEFIKHKYGKYYKYKSAKEYYNYYEYLCLDRKPEDNPWFNYLDKHRTSLEYMNLGYKYDKSRDWALLIFKVIVEQIKKSGNFDEELQNFINPIFERFSKYLPLPKDDELLLSNQRKFNLIENYFDNEIDVLNKIYKRFENYSN